MTLDFPSNEENSPGGGCGAKSRIGLCARPERSESGELWKRVGRSGRTCTRGLQSMERGASTGRFTVGTAEALLREHGGQRFETDCLSSRRSMPDHRAR